MLRSISQLYGNKLGASDGDLGQVKDFYFNDLTWAVRYVVAGTGTWLPGRQVLISPHAFGSIYPAGKVMLVNLTRQQIEDSPAIDTHKPVSRQYEEDYYRYYGFPYYWEGDGLWGGTSGFPVLAVPPKFAGVGPTAATGLKTERSDAHLRSTRAVSGYSLQASDGFVGHVCDFLMDDKSWAIQQLVIKVGHRFTGKDVQLPMSQIQQINYEESTVFVKLSKDAVEKCPEYHLAANGTVVSSHPILAL